MQKKIFSKILSTILVLSLILSVFVPMGSIVGAAEEAKAPSYFGTLNVKTLAADGWTASFSSNPQAGVAFESRAITDLYETWGNGANITRTQNNINWSNNWDNANMFSNMAALTYTTQKYKYFTMTIEYKYGKKNDNDKDYPKYPRPIISFNQQNTTPEMFYKTNKVLTSPSYSEDPIGVFFEYEGSINISGKKTGTSRKELNKFNTPDWHKAEITVTPGNVYVAVYNTDGTIAAETNSTLSSDYQGGYISLMQNGLNFFRNISITKLDYEGDYVSAFTDLNPLKPDGWKGYYSSNPQGGVEFTEIADSNDEFEKYYSDYADGFKTTKGWCLTRPDTSLAKGSEAWNANTFEKMAALTYTPQKYKYFTLTVEYKFEKKTRPWPVITFNQQNLKPEMFYYTNAQFTDPTYSEDVIGVLPNYEGHLRVYGKKARASKNLATSMDGDTPQWHKWVLTVTPGQIYTAVYDKDGNLANEITTTLDESYKGGYITLMQNGVSHFKNISIVEHPEISIDNYYGTPDGNGGIAVDKVFLERTYGENIDYKELVPERAGYNFMGFYSDSEYANKIDLNSTVDREATVYAKWSDFADITADGNVNLKDLVRIKRMASNLIETTVAADLDFDGTNASGTDITVLRKKLLGEAVASNVSSAAELMDAGILYPLGRTMVLENAVEMDHVNTGFVFEGNFEGDIKADFTTNRTGTLLNVSVDGGDNKVIDLNLDGLTTIAEGLPKGHHTIEVISGTSSRYTTTPDTERGTQAYDGTLKLKKLYYSGMPVKYESDKTSKILFIGDSITCGMGLDSSVTNFSYKASNAYYSYASVLGRMLNAEVETIARCGAKVCHFAWADCNASNNEGRGKGLCNKVNWLKSISVRNSAEYDYSNNQPDLIVINLGSNDIPYAKDENGKWVDIWDDTGDKYNEDVTSLLNAVRKVYPNSKILWTVGMMDKNTDISKEYIGYFKSYVETWSAANGDSAYFLDLSKFADRKGHSGHPTIEGHSNAATEIRNFIIENNIGINVGDLADLDSVQKKN